MTRRQFSLRVLAALYFGALVGFTFVPTSMATRNFWVWPFAVFIPVGVLLVLLLGRRRWWAAIGFSLLGSAWLEAAQSVWMPVGYAEAVDVGWATAGATAGVLFTLLVTAPRRVKVRSHKPHMIVTQAGSREIP